jgi:hypothetical protein
MQALNLTETQKALLQWLVKQVRSGKLNEESIWINWTYEGADISDYQEDIPEIETTTLDALERNACISCDRSIPYMYKCALTGRAYDLHSAGRSKLREQIIAASRGSQEPDD